MCAGCAMMGVGAKCDDHAFERGAAGIAMGAAMMGAA